MQQDDQGHPPQPGPEPEEKQDQRPTSDHRQELSLSTKQAAQQLGVNDRTVRTYITERKLPAHQIRTDRGQQYQIYQSDLDAFKEARDRAATEGETSTQIAKAATAGEESNKALQLIVSELERRSQALEATIERLAREAGYEAGRSKELERQLETMQQQVKHLEQERDEWRQKAKALEPPKPHKTHLIQWDQ